MDRGERTERRWQRSGQWQGRAEKGSNPNSSAPPASLSGMDAERGSTRMFVLHQQTLLLLGFITLDPASARETRDGEGPGLYQAWLSG